MRFVPRKTGKTAILKLIITLKVTIFPVSREKIAYRRGVEDRGSLVSVLLALRVVTVP